MVQTPDDHTRFGRPGPGACLALLLFFLLSLWPSDTQAAPIIRRGFARGLSAVLEKNGQIHLEAVPRSGEGLLSFSRRLTGSGDNSNAISSANGGRRKLLRGVAYKVPFDLLTTEYQQGVLAGLFPNDRPETAGWRHSVQGQPMLEQETLWAIALWFTGRGDNFKVLRDANKLTDDAIYPGQTILVPASMLRPALKAQLPSRPAVESPMEFRQEGDEEFAVYRLQAGEALYSSVVVRFTGLLYADDVNALAAEIAEISGIRDVTDIPIGYAVKIPIQYLLPEYLPQDHPRRLEYEAAFSASQSVRLEFQSRTLKDITVILDAGHGGADVGASMKGTWESTYVYDIMVRTRRLLLSQTAATVVPTTRDGDEFRILERDTLPASRGHRVLTSPPYLIQDSKIGVNLRWYLANSVYRQATKTHGDSRKVVFVSIHADSLHSSLRGTMVYVPAAQLRTGTTSRSGSVYLARKEVKERPSVSFSYQQRVESEGLSRQLASRLIDSFRGAGITIHTYKPIRDRITRRRSSYVPAVLRYNAVPAKVLVEVVNLANTQDRGLMTSAGFRERVAEAIVAGIHAYYGSEPPARSVKVAKAAP